MQETPQEHFLNTKARFQKHYDEEDAADLLFACNNLINHGLDLEWDDTLQKMEDIIKEKAEVDTDELLAKPKEAKKPVRYVTDDEGGRKNLIGIKRFMTRDKDVAGRQVRRKERRGSSTFRTREGDIISPESLDFSPSRQYKTNPIGFSISPANKKRLDNAELAGSRTDMRSLIRLLAAPVSQANNQGGGYKHIAEHDFGPSLSVLASDRPKGTYIENGDEHSWLGIFHENSNDPNLFRYLEAYYHPDSPFFVEKKDDDIDAHDAGIMTQALGVDDKSAKDWTEALRGKSPEERARLNHELGHLSPKVLGPIPERMRTRIYRRAFSKWDRWYQRTYPDSPLMGEGEQEKKERQKLFLHHKALKLDGCKLPYIEESLYDDTGEMRRGYLDIIKSPTYIENIGDNRDPSNAMGSRPFEYGLVMLDSDPEKEGLMEMKTCLSLMSQHISHDLDSSFSEREVENQKPDWTTAFLHDDDQANKDPSDHIDERPYAGSNIEFMFSDDDLEGFNGFSPIEFLTYMNRCMFVMTKAYSDAWTGHPSIPNSGIQPAYLTKNPNVWKESTKRALAQAHQFFTDGMYHLDKNTGEVLRDSDTGEPLKRGNPKSVEQREKLSGTKPIFAKVRDYYDDRGEFSEKDGLPMGGAHSYDNVDAVRKTITKWLEAGAINSEDYEHLTEWLDLERGGYGDQTDVFRDWRSHHHSKSWMLSSALKPVDLGELDLRDSTGDQSHEKSPFFPTFHIFSKNGGLGLEVTDPINLYLERNVDLGREVMPSMLELSDMPPFPKNFTEQSKEGRMARERHLPPKWSVTPEVMDAYRNDVPLKDIFAQPATYPKLHELLSKFISRHGTKFDANGPDAETEQKEDSREWQMNHDTLLDQPIDWLVKLGLMDRHAAMTAHPRDGYIPMIEPSADDASLNENGFAHGAWAYHRENPPGAKGGAHGTIPLSGFINRALAHMVDPERINRMLDRLKMPADLLASLALGPQGRTTTLPGEEKAPVERVLEGLEGESKEALLRRLERNEDVINVSRLMSSVSGEGENTHNPQNNYGLRVGDMALANAVRLKHGEKVVRGSDGDGSVEIHPNKRFSHAIMRTNTKGRATDRMAQLDMLARLEASMWGWAGATPMTFGGANLIHNRGAVKALLAHLKSSRRGYTPFDTSLSSHPSPFFRTKDMSDLWTYSASGKARMPQSQDWRASVEMDPKHEVYLYPVEKENGRYYLNLEALDEKSDRASLHMPDITEAKNVGMSLEDYVLNKKDIGLENKPKRLNEVIAGLGGIGAFRGPQIVEPGELDEVTETAQERAYSNKMAIPQQCLVDEGGQTFMLASHPSELLATWSDHVFSHLSPTPHVMQAMHDAHDKAEIRARNDVGTLPTLPEDRERDTLSEAGLSLGSIAETIKGAHDLAMGLHNGGILPALAYATILDSERNPDMYQGLNLQEKTERFLSERIAIDGNVISSHSKEDYDNRTQLQQVMEFGHTYLNNTQGKARKYMHYRILQATQDDEERQEWTNALDRVAGNVKLTSAEHNNTAMEFPEDDVISNLYLTDGGKKDILGHRIVESYLMNHEGVGDVLKQLNIQPKDARKHFKDLVRSIEEKPTPTNDLDANKALKEVGHHEKGQEPLAWRGKMAAYAEDYQAPISSKTGKSRPTTWQLALRRRARSALQSIDLVERFANRVKSRKDFREFQEEFRYLFDKVPVDGKPTSIFDIIQNDVHAARHTDGTPSLPEHSNALQHRRNQSIESEQRAMAQFMFCNGRLRETVAIPKFKPSSGPLSMGVPHEQDPYRMSVDGTKAMSSFNSPWMKRYFGVNHEDAQVPSDEHSSGHPNSFMPMNTDVVNHIFSGLPRHLPSMAPTAVYQNVDEGQVYGVEAAQGDQNIMLSLDALTDTDLIYKSDKKDDGQPVPIKAMHRIFDLSDLEHLRGFSGDWVASAWPRGERVIIDKLKTKINVFSPQNDDISLPNSVLEGIKEASDTKCMIDAIWDEETLHIVDIIRSGDEKMENMPAKDRIRHLRAQFAASDEVSIPAPINTKRVDSEGLERSVKDLLAEKGVKQVLLRDADSTYMRGESRHPKWVLLTPEKVFDVMVLESKGNTHRIGIGPLFDEDGKELGNRATRHDGDFYMDVGSVHHSGLEAGQHVTVKVPTVTHQTRKKMRVYTLNGARYLRDSEAEGTDSIETLDIASDAPNPNVPHKVRVKKGVVHLAFPETHISFETEQIGHSYLLKQADFASDYHLKLAESQREYWSPLAAVLLRSEAESEKMDQKEEDKKKANVVPEPPANHSKKPKKVLKPSERILKDPKVTKQVITALEVLDNLLKEKITSTGPKGLGIGYATPNSEPRGPTTLTEPKNLPDHDPGHRQEKGGDCWCGAKKGQECEQGLATKMEDCPKFSAPSKEESNNHIKIPIL